MPGWWGSVWRRDNLGKKPEVVPKGKIHRATRVKIPGMGVSYL